jgi:hypothetical protein
MVEEEADLLPQTAISLIPFPASTTTTPPSMENAQPGRGGMQATGEGGRPGERGGVSFSAAKAKVTLAASHAGGTLHPLCQHIVATIAVATAVEAAKPFLRPYESAEDLL